MKIQTIYPSVAKKISCPYCRAEGTVKRSTPPQKDFTVVCAKCKERFLVKVNLRKYYRKDVKIPVKYSQWDIEGYYGKTLREGTIIDISRQGMNVEIYRHNFSPSLYRNGRVFTFFFSLPPRNDVLNIKGEITRIGEKEKGHGLTMGVRFSDIDPFAEQQLGFFLLP